MITCSYDARRGTIGLQSSIPFIVAEVWQQEHLRQMPGKLEAASHCDRPDLSIEL